MINWAETSYHGTSMADWGIYYGPSKIPLIRGPGNTYPLGRKLYWVFHILDKIKLLKWVIK